MEVTKENKAIYLKEIIKLTGTSNEHFNYWYNELQLLIGDKIATKWCIENVEELKPFFPFAKE